MLLLKSVPWTDGFSITWELVRNAESQALPSPRPTKPESAVSRDPVWGLYLSLRSTDLEDSQLMELLILF